jgi:hypothetical protein
VTHSLTEGSDFTKKKAGDLFKILLTGIIAIGRKDLLHPSVGAEDNDILKLLKKLHLFSDTSKLTGAHADKRPEYAECQKFFAEDNQEQVTRLVGLLWNIFATVERCDSRNLTHASWPVRMSRRTPAGSSTQVTCGLALDRLFAVVRSRRRSRAAALIRHRGQ